jgi:hypothetical protein
MKIVEGGERRAIDKSNRSTSKSRYGRGWVCYIGSTIVKVVDTIRYTGTIYDIAFDHSYRV